MPLFAEMTEGIIAVLMALSSVLGGAVIWIANYYAGRRKEARAERAEQRAEAKEDEQTIVDHYEKLNERIDRENAELRKEINKLNEKYTRAISHVTYLEGVMESKGIKFRPFNTEGTAPHIPLAGGGGT